MKLFPNTCSSNLFIIIIICEVLTAFGGILSCIAINQIRGWGGLLPAILLVYIVIPGYFIFTISIYLLYCNGKLRRFYVMIMVMRIILIVVNAFTSVIIIIGSENPSPIVPNIFYLAVIILENKMFKEIQKSEVNNDYTMAQNSNFNTLG